MNVVVSVSDKYLWALKPFSYLFNKYWSSDQKVIIAGYMKPRFQLPNNFEFFSIAGVQYPKERWVDGFMEFLREMNFDTFTLFLEDYWLCRNVNVDLVQHLDEMMINFNDIIRMDLTGDRLYAGGMRDTGYYHYADIIQAPGSQYEMSLQCAIWNTFMLKDILGKLTPQYHSAWDVELEGTTILNSLGYKVFGTRQWPVRYVNGMNNAKSSEINFDGLLAADKEIVEELIKEAKYEN